MLSSLKRLSLGSGLTCVPNGHQSIWMISPHLPSVSLIETRCLRLISTQPRCSADGFMGRLTNLANWTFSPGKNQVTVVLANDYPTLGWITIMSFRRLHTCTFSVATPSTSATIRLPPLTVGHPLGAIKRRSEYLLMPVAGWSITPKAKFEIWGSTPRRGGR